MFRSVSQLMLESAVSNDGVVVNCSREGEKASKVDESVRLEVGKDVSFKEVKHGEDSVSAEEVTYVVASKSTAGDESLITEGDMILKKHKGVCEGGKTPVRSHCHDEDLHDLNTVQCQNSAVVDNEAVAASIDGQRRRSSTTHGKRGIRVLARLNVDTIISEKRMTRAAAACQKLTADKVNENLSRKCLFGRNESNEVDESRHKEIVHKSKKTRLDERDVNTCEPGRDATEEEVISECFERGEVSVDGVKEKNIKNSDDSANGIRSHEITGKRNSGNRCSSRKKQLDWKHKNQQYENLSDADPGKKNAKKESAECATSQVVEECRISPCSAKNEACSPRVGRNNIISQTEGCEVFGRFDVSTNIKNEGSKAGSGLANKDLKKRNEWQKKGDKGEQNFSVFAVRSLRNSCKSREEYTQPAQKLQNANKKASSRKGHDDVGTTVGTKSFSHDKKNSVARGEKLSLLKERIRDQIKDVLLSSGWRIELRPRNGRDYEDSVYVCPRGRGYWSITKAYYVFLNERKEASSSEKPERTNSVKSSCSTFSPISDELIGLLKKTILNRRKRVGAGKIDKCTASGKKCSSISISKGKVKKNMQMSDDRRGKFFKKNNICSRSKSVCSSKYRKVRRSYLLQVRGSNVEAGTSSDSYVPYPWKRNIFSLMIDLNILPASTKVKCMDITCSQELLAGTVTRDGIACSCCGKSVSLSEFMTHADSKSCSLYRNIILEEVGASLLECLVKTWEKSFDSGQRFFFIDPKGDDPNDDTCGICGDGGDLMCCDFCPSTFHLNCLNIQKLPLGNWRCMYCSCRFCGELSGFESQESFAADTLLLTCSQCNQRFHKYCFSDDSWSSGDLFCSRSCRQLSEGLQNLVGVRNDLDAGFSCTLIRRFDASSSETCVDPDAKAACNSKVAIALAILDECFLPIIDQRSGYNLVQSVVYNCGSNLNRLNFCNFYTIILERGDEMISAASLSSRMLHGPMLVAAKILVLEKTSHSSLSLHFP